MLQHLPDDLDEIAGEAPAALGFEVSERERVAAAMLQFGLSRVISMSCTWFSCTPAPELRSMLTRVATPPTKAPSGMS